jgi:hypothetical protein
MQLSAGAIKRVSDSLREAKLGDPRRNRRLVKVISKLAERSQASLPDVMGSESELEGAYRLINNPKVTMEALLEAHVDSTASRAREAGEVLAIHDTTPCHFSHADPAAIGYLNTGKPGFYAHYTLVVAAGSRQPLGISSIETISRSRPPRKHKKGRARRKNQSGSQARKKANREFERWQRGIAQTDARLAGCETIHIADRESDSYELMSECLKAHRRFVFRVRIYDRSAQTLTGELGALGALARKTEGMIEREVPLSTRKPRTAPRGVQAHPPRKARLATLLFSAIRLQIRRPRYLDHSFPETLTLNVVRVVEPNPPTGEAPVEWLLFTTEPIDTPEQVAAVVDKYRARWLIEECNKALKTGCLYEHRQFESRHALLTMLALSLPIACEILALRAGARENPERPATDVLSPLQVRILRRLGSRPLTEAPTARDALLAVAALGGHQTSNGEPGWLVLQRGMTKLFAYEQGWRAARATSEDL